MTQAMDEFPEIVRVSDTVAAESVDGGVVLLDLERNQYFGLYGAGARAWDLMFRSGSTKGVIASLVKEFDVEESTLRADLRSFLGTLLEAGLVREGDGSVELPRADRSEDL